MIAAIQAVSSRIDGAISDLGSGSATLLSHFPKDSSLSLHPLIETLGASTDLDGLKQEASTDTKVDEKLDTLTQVVAALRANTLGTQITARKRERRVLEQAGQAATALLGFDVSTYNETLARRAQLAGDLETFRRELFAAADLPSEPDETWSAFVEAGDGYRQHLVEIGAHDKISAHISAADAVLTTAKRSVASIANSEVDSFIDEYSGRDDKPEYYPAAKAVEVARLAVANATENNRPVDLDIASVLSGNAATVGAAATAASTDIAALEEQSENRIEALAKKQTELAEERPASKATGKSCRTSRSRTTTRHNTVAETPWYAHCVSATAARSGSPRACWPRRLASANPHGAAGPGRSARRLGQAWGSGESCRPLAP